MSTSSFNTRTAKISLCEDLYIRIKIIPGSVIDKEDALDNLLVVKNLSGNKKMLKLIDMRGSWQMTPEAKEVSKKNISSENTIARAYVIDSFITKLVIQFFESFSGPNLPQKFFTKEEEAIAWLKEQH